MIATTMDNQKIYVLHHVDGMTLSQCSSWQLLSEGITGSTILKLKSDFRHVLQCLIGFLSNCIQHANMFSCLRVCFTTNLTFNGLPGSQIASNTIFYRPW